MQDLFDRLFDTMPFFVPDGRVQHRRDLHELHLREPRIGGDGNMGFKLVGDTINTGKRRQPCDLAALIVQDAATEQVAEKVTLQEAIDGRSEVEQGPGGPPANRGCTSLPNSMLVLPVGNAVGSLPMSSLIPLALRSPRTAIKVARPFNARGKPA